VKKRRHGFGGVTVKYRQQLHNLKGGNRKLLVMEPGLRGEGGRGGAYATTGYLWGVWRRIMHG